MKRVMLFAVVVIVAAILIVACKPPLGDDPGDLAIPITALSLDSSNIQIQVGATHTLTATLTPADATGAVTWSTSDAAVATVAAGVVTGAGPGSATIRVASAADPSIYAECSVLVATSVEAMTGWGLFNQPDRNAEVIEGTTTEMPNLLDDTVTLYSPTDQGALDSDEFNGYTILHFNTSYAGDFRVQARANISDIAADSSAKGILVGAVSQSAADEFLHSAGAPLKWAFMMMRANGQTRSYYSTPASWSAGSPQIADSLDEYIVEVKRTSTGITFSILNSVSGTLIADNEVVNAELSSDVTDGGALFPVLAVSGATARFSNIKIYSGTEGVDETLVYDTTEVAGMPVSVAGVELIGTQRYPTATYDYQNSVAGATADTIQLSAAVTPDQADDTSAAWSSSSESVVTVDAAGLVSVVGAGDATITVTTTDGGFTDTFALHLTAGDVAVAGITVQGLTDIQTPMTQQYTVDITPTDATNQDVTWDSSDEAVATIDANGLALAKAEGTTTLTATATDGSGIFGTLDVNVTLGSQIAWDYAVLHPDWPEQDPATAASTAVTYTSDVVIDNGLIINLFDDVDGKGVRSCRYADAANGSAPSGSGFSDGRLQPNGAGLWGTLVDVQGPFQITINYTSAGSSERYPGIIIDGGTTNVPMSGSTATDDPQTYVFSYAGIDLVTVDFTAEVSGIRVYDLVVDLQ
jgi:uncharacterized protein YjdB